MHIVYPSTVSMENKMWLFIKRLSEVRCKGQDAIEPLIFYCCVGTNTGFLSPAGFLSIAIEALKFQGLYDMHCTTVTDHESQYICKVHDFATCEGGYVMMHKAMCISDCRRDMYYYSMYTSCTNMSGMRAACNRMHVLLTTFTYTLCQ